jgi:hypothetical protein
MGKQLSRALETRHSVSGTHSENARVARRVARAGLTMGGSSDDTMEDLLKPSLRRLSWPLFLFLSSCGSLVCVLTSSSFFRTCPIFVLGPAISNLTPSSPNPQACAHIPSVPRNPTLTTHIHIIQYTPRIRRFSFAFTLFFILLYQSRLIPRAISICAPFFIPRLFRSLCPNSICLLLSYCLSFLSALALVTGSICALSLPLPQTIICSQG